MTSPKLHRTALVAALLSLGLVAGAMAQAGAGTSGSTSTQAAGAKPGGNATALAKDDRAFVEKAAMHGMAEVQLGELAQQKAVSDEVKQFGARMVQDHGKANDELKQVAGGKGVQLPASVDKKHAQDMQKLQKLSGAEFDREYMKHMVDDHKKDISEFEKQSKSGKDPDIRNFAAKTLPTLQEHLKLAQSVNDAVKRGKSGSADSAQAPPGRPAAATGGAAPATQKLALPAAQKPVDTADGSMPGRHGPVGVSLRHRP